MVTYERKLDSDPELAIREGGMHFEGESAVHKALRRITAKLDDLGIPYALAGAMALFYHGYRRFTENIDLVMTSEGLSGVREELVGHGYLGQLESGGILRDPEYGVRVKFFISGECPGDGKQELVVFPDPREFAVRIQGINCLTLAKVIELKLAYGASTMRLKDVGEVQEVIRVLKLGAGFAGQLDESVRPRYLELWGDLNRAGNGYE